MDSEKCRTLLRVVELGNIRAAANELGYTPSGISRMMVSLEQELGVSLLIRSKQGVCPTDACTMLLPHVRRVVQVSDSLVSAAGDIAGLEVGVLRVGTAYPQLFDVLAGIMGAFKSEHPGIKISVCEANSTPLAEALESGELDFIIISRRSGSFAWTRLANDQMKAIVPNTHPLAQADTYPLERFAIDPFIEIGPDDRTDNARVLGMHKITPNTCYSVSADDAGYRLVDVGLGVTLTNSLHLGRLHNNVAALACEPAVSVEIGIATQPTDIATPAALAFADYATPKLIRHMKRLNRCGSPAPK